MMTVERISPLATRSCHERMIGIDRELIRVKVADAKDNARLREIHCFHAGADDTLHRMLNAIQPGSYVRPHRHLSPPKAESMIILSGSVGVIPFLDDGTPDRTNFVLISHATDTVGIDIRAGVWHTILAVQADSVVFEVKPGPYTRLSDKDFAPWSPADGTDEAKRYLADLDRIFRERFNL